LANGKLQKLLQMALIKGYLCNNAIVL